MGAELIRHFGGKAAYLAFCAKLQMIPDWDKLSDVFKEAWIAAAHEANMLQWIIENNKPEPTDVA